MLSRYLPLNTWFKLNGSKAVIGLTPSTRNKLGPINNITGYKYGSEIGIGDIVCTIQSSKEIGLIRSPIKGCVTKINRRLDEDWICEIDISK